MLEMADRYDWVEIVEPRSGDHMFANLKSGQCLWEPPEGANVKATSDNQWWELYDSNTRRYYYYNSATQKTVWRKPKEADIIALAKLQLLKAKEAKHGDKSSFKSKTKSRHREGSIEDQSSNVKTESPASTITSFGHAQDAYGSNNLPKLRETNDHDYVNVSFDNKVKYDVCVVKSSAQDDKPVDMGRPKKTSVVRTLSLEGSVDIDDVKGRKTKWMSVRDNKSIDKYRSIAPPKFEASSVPLPEDEQVESTPGGGPKRAPPKPPRGPGSPAKSPRKLSLDSHFNNLYEGALQGNPAAPTTNENGVDEGHIYDEFDQHNSSGNSVVEVADFKKDVNGKTIERPARPPPPAPSGCQTLPNPKRKLPEPYMSAHTPVTYDSGSLSRNIKLALDKKDATYHVLSTDEESNDGNLSPLSQLMADVQGYDLSNAPGLASPEEIASARSQKSTAEPTAPSGTISDDDRAHYMSMYDNVEDDPPTEPTEMPDQVEGCVISKAPPAPPPPPPPHAAVYESIPSEPVQLERKPSLNKSTSVSLHSSQMREAVPLSTHRKGLFRRRMSIASMLSWSKTPIRKPMVLTRDKQLRKEAVDVFKLILQYMGDKTTRKNIHNIGLDIVCKGWSTSGLRDEIYVQLCKQTTENLKESSLQRGWELMCMCLAMFPTSNKFHSYLEGYIYRHLDPESNDTEVPLEAYAKHCYKQLERICGTGAKRGNKKPTLDELEQAKDMVFNPSMFGNTLEDIMEMQAERFPQRRLPWIITTLADTVFKCNALRTEGIFRVPGDIDEVNILKVHVDKWKEVTRTYEPHIPASLLKLWFRDLHAPLIPQAFYDSCIHNCEDATVTLGIVYSLPELNHWVFGFLVQFLQSFMKPESSAITLMDENNLAMVWAPNCLRCPSDDPMEILESTRKEMAFLRTIMRNWDTSFLDGVL